MNQAEMLARFAREAAFDCFLLAGRYTLLDQVGLRELLPLCVEKGIRIIVGGPYNSGILALGAVPSATYNYRPAPPALLEKTARIAAVCARYNVPLRAAAIQFPLAHPAVIAAIPGARSVEEVTDNARMMGWPIPRDLWLELRRETLIDPGAPVPGD
jgi:D-threo-aldose 1-dehydrogenase